MRNKNPINAKKACNSLSCTLLLIVFSNCKVNSKLTSLKIHERFPSYFGTMNFILWCRFTIFVGLEPVPASTLLSMHLID